MITTLSPVSLSSPWVSYVHKIESIFKGDEEVVIQYDNDLVELKIFVSNDVKADALAKLLPSQKTFGNVILTITVYPPNMETSPRVQYFEDAFRGNPNVADVVTIGEAPNTPIPPMTFVIFRKEVIQYFDDNLHDAHGNTTTLNEVIARDVFGESEGIFFCTDNKDVNTEDISE